MDRYHPSSMPTGVPGAPRRVLFSLPALSSPDYDSQYEGGWERPISQAQKVRMRLGGSGSMDEPFPPKPKGMHWRTYRRLEKRDERAEQGFAWLLDNWTSRGLLR
ncbi:MAG: hypothetical protein AB7G07_01190 [Bauldia sp.]